jgi:hypothetical protein
MLSRIVSSIGSDASSEHIYSPWRCARGRDAEGNRSRSEWFYEAPEPDIVPPLNKALSGIRRVKQLAALSKAPLCRIARATR